MADFEPPSFSLGLDLHYDSDPQIRVDSVSPKPENDVAKEEEEEEEEDEDELGSHVVDSDPESGPEPVRVLKRLRRGLPKPRETTPPLGCRIVDDDIEDFSSEEDVFEEFRPSTQYHSMCSSSKVPLNGFRAVKEKKTEPGSNFLPSSSTVKSHGENPFQKPEVSPLRMFQLIDSDSDESSKNAENIIRKSSGLKPQREEDLWKEFTPIKSFRVSTPALDELCEEYFRSGNGNNNRTEKAPKSQSVDPIAVPAHRYFLHCDHRIRKLVRDRLPNFYPLGIIGDNGSASSLVIDYMGQFGNKEEAHKQAKKNVRKHGNNSNGDTSRDSPNWVDPKLSNGTTQRSRARKVTKKSKNTAQTSREGSESVNVGSNGQWYSANGRKVYINKNGQELTGQMAYRQYKRDRGGYGKAKRKTSSKKKKKS